MCDCFHLAFPNWHAPAAGAGRRLRGPEEDSEIQDSVCEEPEILESERPRPQGSSPIEEFPIEKQTEEDPYDLHKGGSTKKSKKIGFGGLLDKRTSAKMNEESDSEMIVTAVKETYTKGLVVTGGKKDGIFIKEVKPDSPASKLLSVKEGDQILSATIYFDNVSHEDALQILEHAQPYKMEFCLKRRVISTVPKHAETALSEGKDGSSPKMRGQRRMKKQQDRISWPKFPSFGKGHKAQFRRSHSTSEAEEQRKLEISPPTSDAESPFKSPLKSPDGKDKRKKHKVKLKMKMKGHRSKSEEDPHKTEKEPTSEVLVVLENQDGEVVLEENVSDECVKKYEPEYDVASKIEKNEQTLPSLSEMEGQHEVNLISLGNTLKTTNIPVALLEREKTECSEIKLRINEGEIFEVETESQSKSLLPEHRAFEPSAFDSIIPQAAKETPQPDTDSGKQEKDKDSSDKNVEYKNVELSIPAFSDVGEEKKSLTIGSEKQQKEKYIHENASYGIRTRGPLAGMATSKTHFINTLNGLQFMSPDTGCDVTTDESHLKLKTSDAISANLDKTFESNFRLPNVDLSAFENHETIKMTETEIKTRLPKREEIEIPGMEAKELKQNIPVIKEKKIEKIINITKKREIQDSQTMEEFNVRDVKEAVSKFPAFKLPERDITGVLVQREIKIMEKKADKTNLTPKGSPSKILITSTSSSTTITESKIGKEISSPSAAVEKAMKIPKAELPYIDDQTITDTHIDYKKPTRKTQLQPDKILKTDDGELIDVNFKLPKREDIEIPGMEAIKECNVQNTEDKTAKDKALHQVQEQSENIRSSLLLMQENAHTMIKSDAEKGKKPKTKKHGDIKGQEKKSKKPKTTLSSTVIPKPEFAFPESGTVLEVKEDSSKKDEAEIKKIGETKITTDKQIETPEIMLPKNLVSDPIMSVNVGQEINILEDNPPLLEKGVKEAKADQTVRDMTKEKVFSPTKFKIPSITFPQFGAKTSKAAIDVSPIDVQFKDTEISSNKEQKLPPSFCTESHVNKDVSSANVSVKSRDTEDIHDKKFKLPKFEISFPEVKAPKITLAVTKKESEAEVSPQNVDVSLEGSENVKGANTNIEMTTDDSEQKDSKKFGSPSRFKLPSITFPKFGVKSSKVAAEASEMDLGEIKRPEINVPEAEVELSADPVLADVHKKTKPVSVEMKDQKIQSESKDSTFKMPKFGIRLPEVKGPKIDLSFKKAETEVSVPEGNVEVHPPDVNKPDVTAAVKSDLPEIDSKCLEVKIKKPGFTLPTAEFGKSEIKAPVVDVTLSNADVSLPEAKIEMEIPHTDIKLSEEDSGQKDSTKFVSPTKFKLPSISLPKIGVKLPKAKVEVPDVDVDVKGPEIKVPDAEPKVSIKPLSVEIKGPDVDKEANDLSVEIKEQDISIKGQESTFKMPKFGIRLPEVKGPKIDLSFKKAETEVSVPEGKVEVHPPDVNRPEVTAEVKADLPEIDSKCLEIKIKKPGFTLPTIGFGTSEIKAPEVDVTLPNADVSLPEASIEMEIPHTDIQLSKEDSGQKDSTKFGFPTKFTLPSISLPKIGVEIPKAKVEVSDVDVKGPEINVPDAEAKLSIEPLSVKIKGPDVDKEAKALNVEIKEQDISIKGQDSTFNLPKFGMRLPEVKGPKIDLSFKKAEIKISVPEGKVEMHPPDVNRPDITAEVKADLPEIDSKGVDIKIKRPGITFPSIGFGKSEIKAPEVDVTLPNADVSLPEASIEMEIPNTDIQLSKEDSGQKDSIKFGSPTKFKLPSISLPKIGVKLPKAKVEVPGVDVDVKGPEINVPDTEAKLSIEPLSADVSLPEASIEMEGPHTDIKLSKDSGQKESTNFGSPTKFKLPTISFPKIGVKLPKAKVEVSDVDVDVKGPEINVPDAKAKLSIDPISVEIKGPDVDKGAKALNVEIKEQDISIKGQDSTFNIPKFGIRLPEVKGPKIDLSFKKAETEISVPEGKVEVHPPDVIRPNITAEVKADLPEIDSKGVDIKIKRPGFTFPSFGFGKSEIKAPVVDVTLPNADVSLPQASIEMEGPHTDIQLSKEDSGQKESTKFGSPTKFKLPSISLPKIGVKLPKAKPEVSGVDVDVKGPEINVPDAEPKLSIEPLSVDVSLPEASIEMEGPNTDMKLSKKDSGQKESTKFGSPTKFKLPSISFPKIGVKLPKAKVEVSDVDVDVKGPEINVPDAEPKLSVDPLSVKIKGPDVDKEANDLSVEIKEQDISIKGQDSTFNIPKFGIRLPEVKGPKIDLSFKKAETEISVPEGKVEVHPPDVNRPDITAEVKADLPEIDSKGADIKIKRPGITFPSIGFGKSEIKAPVVDVTLPNADMSLPQASIEMEGPHTDIQLSKEDSGQKESTKFGSPTKFKLPSISLPKIGVKLPKAKPEVSGVDVDVKGPEINVPDAEPKLSIEPLSVDVSLPEASIEMEGPNTDMKLSKKDSGQKESTKFGSPTKFTLPSISFPKIGVKFPKAKVEVPGVDVDVKGPEINVPDAEPKLSVDPLSVKIKGPDVDKEANDLSVEIKEQDISIKGQDSTFNLPKFGIRLPEVKGPKIDLIFKKAETEISVPEGKVEVHPPDVNRPDITAEVKADLPEIDSKGVDIKIRRPGFTFPSIGFGKSEIKAPVVDVTLPNADVSLPQASIEMEGPHTDIQLSKEDSEQKDSTKFGSPTKFKLPSISFPKFGTKAPKAKVELPDVDVDVKGPEINVPDAEPKLSIKPLLVEIKGPDVDKEAKALNVEIKEQDISIKGQDSTFNLPKFGIRLPEVKGPKIDLSFKKAETEISVPEGKVEVHPPNVNRPDITAEVKADLPEIDSKGVDIKIKRPGFTFPSFGFGKSEMKAPEVDVTLPNADVSLPEASIEIEGPHTDIQLSKEDSGQKDSTKFELPSISLPKIAVKVPKAKVEVSDVDVDVKGPEINVPDAEAKLSIEPLSFEIKGPDLEKEAKALNVEIKEQDILIKGQESTFNLPKFGIRLPEVKRPKIDLSFKKAETEVSVPEGKVEVHPLDVNRPDVTAEVKADLPKIDSKRADIKIRRPEFTFPSIGFGKSEIKAPEVDVTLPKADVSLPQASIEMEGPHTDIKLSKEDSGQKDSTKFGSPTKFKLPSISLPKIGVKLPKAKVEVPDMDVDVKGPEINVPDAEPKLSIKPLSADVSLPEASIEMEGPNTDIKLSKKDSGQKESTKFGSPTKFKLPSISFPKFGTKLPKAKLEVPDVDVDVKGPEINVPDAEPKLSIKPLSVEIKGPDVDKEAKALNVEIKEQDISIKGQDSTFNLPKFGIRLPEVKGPKIDFSFKKAETEISKSEIKAPEVDVTLPNADVSLPEASIEMEGPHTDIQLSKEDSGQKDSTKFGSPTKFKLPSISLPKIGVKLPKAKVEVSDVDVDVKGPKINVPDAEAKLSIEPLSVDVTLPEASIEMEGPHTDIKLSREDSGQKESTKFGSPTKFKLPTISLPNFGPKASKTKVEVSDMDVEGPEINVPDAKLQLPAEQLSVAIKGPDMNKEAKSVSVEIKDQDFKTEGEDSTFKLPKFEFSLPEIKGPKIDFQKKASKEGTNVSVSTGKLDVHPPDVNVTAEVKADIPEMDSKAFEVKMKRPGFTFPTFGSGKSEIQAAEADLNLPNVDVSLPEAIAEVDGQNTDLTLSKKDSGQKDSTKFGSPTKFKLPSISFPKFGTKVPKAKVEVSDVDVDVKGPEINVPDAELKLPAKSLSVDIKEPDMNKEAKSVSVGIKDQNFQTEGKDSTFKLPKFGISLPEIKGPKIDFSKKKADIEISAPEGMVEIHQPTVDVQDVKAEVKADPLEVSLPEASIETIEQNTDNKLSKEGLKDSTKFGSPTKFKLPSISLPKFGAKVPKLSSEVSDVDVDVKKTEKGLADSEPEADVILPNVDVSLPEGSEQRSKKESKQKDSKFGSPTKFKLPSISLPKFGVKVTKVAAEEPEGPDVEIKLTTEPIKEQDILITGRESLPEVKGPTTDLGSDMEAKISEMHPSDVKVQDVTTEVKADLPEVDLKVPGVKVKMSGFSLPKFGVSKSESSEADADVQNVNVSLPQASAEMEEPKTEDVGQKASGKFDSPTKFKLPSIKLPKFGLQVTKETVNKSSVEVDVKPPEISDSELKLSAQPLDQTVDIKLSNVDSNGTAQLPAERDHDVEINNKVETLEMTKISISKSKSQSRDPDTFMSSNVPGVTLEPKLNEYTQELKKSPKTLLPSFGDIVKAFDVEFYIPTLDEIEEAKKYTSDSIKLEYDSGISQPSVYGNEGVNLDITTEKKEKQTEDKLNKNIVFEFSSTTKTVKVEGKEAFQPPNIAEESPINDLNDKEAEQSSTREVEVDSPTLSMRSSDAFADVSSATITEQITSPTKVKVKYSESTAAAEVGDIHSKVFTSTARTELITIVPHQPEKVNIPFSSEASSSSVDTFKEMSGKIHIIKNYVQSESDTAVLTNTATQNIQTLFSKSVAESVLSVENTTVQKEHTLVEKHVVKEMFGDDEDSPLVMQTIQIFEGAPILDDTTYSIQKLRDTVHSEKMRFFESGESSKTIVVSTETKILKRADFSKEDSEEK